MLVPHFTRQFKKDVKPSQKRGKDIRKFKEIMVFLVDGHKLAEKYKDHSLKGEFIHYRECHIEPDWLLIYKLETSGIFFIRLGTHSDLFE